MTADATVPKDEDGKNMSDGHKWSEKIRNFAVRFI